MRQRSLLIGLVAALGLAAVPRAVQADVRGWNLCTSGAFHSCHSIQITTMGVFSGNARVGTNVTVALHNLNGQVTSDNTIWSGLYQAFFWGNTAGQGGGEDGISVPHSATVIPSGGAVGSNTYGWYSSGGGFGGPPGAGFVGVYADGSGVIGGCTPSAFTAVLTCGAGAVASLSFTTFDIFDASAFNTAFIYAVGESGATQGPQAAKCFSDPSLFSPAPDMLQKCDVLPDDVTINVTPEPVSVALLGSGLLGLGGVRLRRRKKDDASR